MKRHLTMMALFIAGVLAGCAPEGTPQALIIQGNSVVGSTSSCKIPSSGGGVLTEARSVGTLDLLFGSSYILFPSIANKLSEAQETSEAGSAQGALEPNGIVLTGARVWYEIEGLQGQWDGGETLLPDEIFAPTSGYLDPGGFATVALEILPAAVVTKLDGDTAFDNLYSGGYLIAHVVMEGRTLDGDKVRSNEFVFPIQVCRGCLLYWPFLDPSNCCDALKTDAIVCFPGQDEAIACDVGCTMVDYDPRYEAKLSMIKKESTSLGASGASGNGVEDDVVEDDTL